MMNKNKEAIVGVAVFIIAVTIIVLFLGIEYVYISAIFLFFAALAIYLFSKDNIFAKAAGILSYEGIVLKVLMPAKYRKRINELKDKDET